jgi:large subunit ribosomal protein L14e
MRKALNLKSLYLTKFLVRIPHSARTSTLMKQWTKCEIDKKWAESNWAKKLAAAKIRANLTDFQRYKLMRAKQAVSGVFFKLIGGVGGFFIRELEHFH